MIFYNNSEFLKVNDVMELLGIGRNTVYKLLNTGELTGFRIGRTWRVSRNAISNYVLQKNKQG